MPVEADLVAYLDPLIAYTAGTDLFEGPMPERPEACVIVHHTGGTEAERVMAPSLTAPELENVRVMVMVRDPVKATCQTAAAAIHALLDGLGPVTLSGRLYHSVNSIDGEPKNLGQDKNGLWQRTVNYAIRKARG